MSSTPAVSPVRVRLDQCTDLERTKLAEVLKLKPLLGGAAMESRLEVAYFDACDRARPKLAAGYLSYGAALAMAHLLTAPPTKQEVLDDVAILKKLLFTSLGGTPTPASPPQPEGEDLLATAERLLLAHAGSLSANGKGPGVDPVRAALKVGVPAFLLLAGGSLGPALAAASFFGSSWDFDALERLVKASILMASVGERLRLEALISSSSQSTP